MMAHRSRLLAIAAAALAATLAATAAACVPFDEVRDDDPDKTKAKGADDDKPVHTGPPTKKEAFEARWLDATTRAKCLEGPMVLDRLFDVDIPPRPADVPAGSEAVNVSFEICGPVGPSLPDAGRLRLVWARAGTVFGETACELPDIPAGSKKGPENPARVSCPGNVVEMKAPGDYGLDLYLGDVLLRETKFQVVAADGPTGKALAVDKTPRYLESWLGVTTDKDGWPDRAGLEIRLPAGSHDTVIYSWFRDGKQIRKPREAEAADFDGERVWLVGPAMHNLLGKPGDYEVNVAVGGAAARTAFFSVKKGGKLGLHPRQKADAVKRVTDRFLLTEVTISGFAGGAEAIPPDKLETFGLFGKGL